MIAPPRHEGEGRRGRGAAAWAAGCVLAGAFAAAANAQTADELAGMSLEQLANVDVTSVSKRTERLSDAPAAIYVITHEAIMRSGASRLPEILRLAPNLQVALISANSYAITARGFNGNAADKLLVMIDGRSVYTPLFGGVQWDEQDVPPEDIERIEVISGPGATLWGANAVNGVINIITRKASATPGGFVDVSGGNRGGQATLQYGGRIADDLSWRAYVNAFSVASDKLSTGADAGDGWSKVQSGFRLDWTPANDAVSLQADLFRSPEQQGAAPHEDLSGGHLQLNWTHRLQNGDALQALAYYDETRRFADGVGGYWLKTYDLELQHSFSLGERQKIVWGVGARAYQDQFENSGPAVYLPARSTEGLADVFGQDTIALTRSLSLTAGVKVEKDPYSRVAALPNLRLSWKPVEPLLLWTAASRAVRAPTLFDEDLQDTLAPSVLVLQGNPRFRTEQLTAYEAGARYSFGNSASLSVSTYYNVYHDLRSVEWLRSDALPLLLTWGNLMEGHTYGLEVWGEYRPTSWWRLNAGFNLEHEALRYKPGASSVNTLADAGDDPHGQAQVRSFMALGHGVSWNADLRYVGALPDPRVPGYAELDTNVSWAINEKLEVSIVGQNLLHRQHLEYEEAGAVVGVEAPRSVAFETRLRF